jgi:2-dehydro-3-deoxyglucarate aldolase
MIDRGKISVGTWVSSGSSIIAELLAQSGADFVCVDVEHSAVDLSETQKLFQAIRSGAPRCKPYVRLAGVDYAQPKRYADAGARGIIGPLVNSREAAETLVRSAKYPPLGQRGVGFCRANGYGARLEEHFEKANGEIEVVVQIEHIEAVNNIDEILSVDGVDTAFIGPYDLSASMGLTAQFNHPEFIRARRRILESCVKNGVRPGIHVIQPNPDEVMERIAEGFQMIAFSLDITVLLGSFRSGFQRIEEKLSLS